MALLRLASVLRKSVREVDVAARYGGEESAILLPSTPKLAALKLAEKLRSAVEKAGIGKDGPGGSPGKPLTVSVGVASLPGDAANAEELVDRADSALYIAKSMGKNCVKPFSDERREHTRPDATLSGFFHVLAKERHPLATTNVSEGGILFHSAEQLPSGALLKLQLALPPAGEPIECAVKVLRVIGARGGFEIGTAGAKGGHATEKLKPVDDETLDVTLPLIPVNQLRRLSAGGARNCRRTLRFLNSTPPTGSFFVPRQVFALSGSRSLLPQHAA